MNRIRSRTSRHPWPPLQNGSRKLAIAEPRANPPPPPRHADAGLQHLVGLNRLESLDVTNTNITASGLRAIKSFRNLHTLHVMPAHQSLHTLREVGLLHTLTQASTEAGDRPMGPDDVFFLDFRYGNLTDEALRELTVFKKLRWLNLSSSHVTDTGLEELKHFPKLLSLNLNEGYVTNAGMKNLTPLTELHDLDLTWTRISSMGLKDVASLQNLRYLELERTRFPMSASTSLRRSRTSPA
jgi:hypothetical protein